MPQDLVSALASAVSNTRAAFLATGIVLSLSSAAWAQSPSAAHDGPCRVAIIQGEHIQPSPNCHLPPPLAQNPASIEHTPPALREEIERLATDLLRLSTPSGETELYGSSTIRPRPLSSSPALVGGQGSLYPEGGGSSTACGGGAGISPPNPLDAHSAGDVWKPSNRNAEKLATQPRQEYAEKRAAAQRTGP
jgi:hypothetical protein